MNITELCVNCKQNNACTMCWKTSNKKCSHFIQKTNADRIRAMSDEEFVRMLGHNSICDYVQDHSGKHCEKHCSCDGCLVEWLKQPAEEGAENG